MMMNTFEQRFENAVADIYDAEHRFLEVQQEMLEKSDAPQLKSLLEAHNRQSKGHIATLEQVFRELGKSPHRVECDSSKGIAAEARELMREAGTPEILNWVIASAQAKIEHYEIASYRGLIHGAQAMKNEAITALLQKNLQQEEQTIDAVQGEATDIEEKMAGEAMKADS